MTELTRAALLFTLGGIVALTIIIQLRAFGPLLGDRINEQMCIAHDGIWDYDKRVCKYFETSSE